MARLTYAIRQWAAIETGIAIDTPAEIRLSFRLVGPISNAPKNMAPSAVTAITTHPRWKVYQSFASIFPSTSVSQPFRATNAFDVGQIARLTTLDIGPIITATIAAVRPMAIRAGIKSPPGQR